MTVNAQKGRDFRLQVKISGSFYFLDGETSLSGAIGQEAVNSTDKPKEWRELLPGCGLRTATVKADGLVRTGDLVSVFQELRRCAMVGDPVVFQVVTGGAGSDAIYIGSTGIVTSFERDGDSHDAEKYSISIESITVVTIGGEAATTVETPVISPNGGAITTADLVSITCATVGASIWYTIDGSTPTTSSTPYTAPFTLKAKMGGYWEFPGNALTNTWAGGASLIPGTQSGYVPGAAPVVTGGVHQSVFPGYPGSDSALSSPALDCSSGFTIAAKMYQDSANFSFGAISLTSGALDIVNVFSTGAISLPQNGLSTSFSPTYGTAVHIAATYDGTTFRVYKDGAQVYSGAHTISGLATAAFQNYFAGGTGSPLRWNDNLLLRVGAMTPAEVTALAGGAVPTVPTSTVKAFATKAGLTDSKVVSATFTVTAPCTPGKFLGTGTATSSSVGGASPAINTALGTNLTLPATGKAYFEMTWTGTSGKNALLFGFVKSPGVSNGTRPGPVGSQSTDWAAYLGYATMYTYQQGTYVGYGSGPSSGTRIGVAWDASTGQLQLIELGSFVSLVMSMIANTAYAVCVGVNNDTGDSGNNIMTATVYTEVADWILTPPAGWSAANHICGAS